MKALSEYRPVVGGIVGMEVAAFLTELGTIAGTPAGNVVLGATGLVTLASAVGLPYAIRWAGLEEPPPAPETGSDNLPAVVEEPEWHWRAEPVRAVAGEIQEG